MTVLRSKGRDRRTFDGLTDRIREDSGTSLIELVVGMSILSIFLAMFTGAVIMMNQATNKAQAVSLSSLQVNQAFLRLDKTVRYATAISTPGQCIPIANVPCTTSDWYVEFLTTSAGAQLCTQLRIDSKQLQARSWNPVSAPPAQTPDQFTPLASGITNGTVTDPFVLGSTALYQQLSVTLAAQSGSASTQVTASQSTFTFSALNSSISPAASPNCLAAGRS